MVSTTQMIGQSPVSAENTQEPKATAAPDETVAMPEPIKQLDPTRYGDWEKNGRCIDF